ncbi:MAG: 4Fe-4S binding protein [Desulforhabdus sp.]|jgi:Fe-S-cluster-containing hydrogenase component 2|nr:4Fe-4S binding protein [Desulforhabdus sp.]
MQTEPVYEKLAEHLNRLPAGFPRTSSGVEMRILRRLFTPEEASLAPLLSLKPEAPAEIAARAERPTEEIAQKLLEMSHKGLIFRLQKGTKTRYMAAQFVIGIWEYHVNDLDLELIRDMNEYIPHFFDQSYYSRTPQLRTIPISGSISAEQAVMPYEEARRIIEEQDKIIVAPCICRKEHQMTGKGCDRPLESCLVFGVGAVYYEENGLGRSIDRQEALDILQRAEQAGLVLQPSNAKKVVNICTCCGCCCQILKNLKKLPKPAEFVASNHYATIDRKVCTGCETCLDRCQMEAVRMEEGSALIDADRCIGCGLCVPTCMDGAIALKMKTEDRRREPPRHFMETYMRIAQERIKKLQEHSGN